MGQNEQIGEAEMLARLQVGEVLLAPLVVRSVTRADPKAGDAHLGVGLPTESEGFRFVVEVKGRATPQAVQLAITQARAAAAGSSELPMIQVPFLSSKRLVDLEREGVSGVDLCGNGLVVVPGRLYVLRTGEPNRYRDSRPLNNPYRGRSAMVARMLLLRPRWESLSALAAEVRRAGGELSLPQVSKAVQALAEDLVVSKEAGVITLQEPLRLLDELGRAWRQPRIRARQALRLPAGTDWATRLSSRAGIRWALTGASSVKRYTAFSESGPHLIAVSDIGGATALLNGTREDVPSFADIELIQTDEAGFFFDNEIDDHGVRWASRLQAWLELQSGDARQQSAAHDLRSYLLRGATP